MALSVTHSTVVVVPDDQQSPVGTDEWNSAHTITGLGTGVLAYLENGVLGIGTATPATPLEIYKPGASYATSGTASSGLLRIGPTQNDYVLDIGSHTSFPGTWFQGTNRADLSLSAPLWLNPNGGQVLINTTISGISDSNSQGLQIGDNWTNSAAYAPGSNFGLGQINLYGTGLNNGINCWIRTSNISGAGIALSSYAFANNSAARGAWPIYTEAHRVTQLDYSGSEFAVVNHYNDVNPVTPWGASSANGGAAGLQIDAGNGESISKYTEYSCSYAIRFCSNYNADQVNGRGFANGIVFAVGSMDQTINPIAPAISFPSSATYKYALTWYTSQSHALWNIYSDGTSTVNNNSLLLSDSSATLSTALTVSGAVTFGVGGNHFTYSAPGSGAWYDTSTTANRFFVGADLGTDGFRIYTAGLGGNAVVVSGVNGDTYFQSNSASTSTASGSIILTGGAGIAGSVSVGGEIRADGDVGGLTSCNTLTGTSDITANSTGVGSIKFKGATSRDSTGFIKIYIGTTAYYVPVFSAITG